VTELSLPSNPGMPFEAPYPRAMPRLALFNDLPPIDDLVDLAQTLKKHRIRCKHMSKSH